MVPAAIDISMIGRLLAADPPPWRRSPVAYRARPQPADSRRHHQPDGHACGIGVTANRIGGGALGLLRLT